jgi:hypothetical protein
VVVFDDRTGAQVLRSEFASDASDENVGTLK